MNSVLWLRRDLRLHDHPALHAAAAHDRMLPVFCLDRRLLTGRHRSAVRSAFMLACLRELAGDLERAGSGLTVVHELPEQALPRLAAAAGAKVVYATGDVSVFARRRDAEVAAALGRSRIELKLLPGTFAVDDLAAIRTGSGDPYSVFTPFYRRWLKVPRREVLPAIAQLPPIPEPGPGSYSPARKQSDVWDLSLPVSANAYPEADRHPRQQPGERAARVQLDQAASELADAYPEAHDLPGVPGTSELSVHLHFGSVSAREVESRLGDGDGPEAIRRQLCWRDFCAHVLLHNPANTISEHQPRYRRTIRWSGSLEDFEAWRDGRTGYPLVDAGMRQLAATGWIHNRVRMVVGSFLVKDLGIDWRWGERWFMRALVDGDQASNNGNWQWIASVGVDPAPVARRILNPTLQQQRFDPDGEYVRAYVPELRGVPDDHLPEPWTMPADLQREIGCVIGAHYPSPIVEHLTARRAALERYSRAAGRS